MRAPLPRPLAGATLLLLVATIARAEPVQDPALGERLLREAFRNQYELDSTAEIELVMRNRAGHEQRRRFETASKRIDGRLHSIGRLTWPEHLRGMTILQVETGDGHHDAFVYLPSSRSVRRVSTAQRGDAFFGTDVTYEDLERRRANDYEVREVQRGRIDGEPVWVVAARPRRPLSYHEARFTIADRDHAILAADFFKRGAAEPFRSIRVARRDVFRSRGHALPARLVVENRARGTSTAVSYRRLRVDPEIDERVFSVRTLERRGRIPGAP